MDIHPLYAAEAKKRREQAALRGNQSPVRTEARLEEIYPNRGSASMPERRADAEVGQLFGISASTMQYGRLLAKDTLYTTA